MLPNIIKVLNDNTENIHTITDIFAGTGIVSKTFKDLGYFVTSNDILYLSYVLNKGVLEQQNPISPQMKEIISDLNHLTIENSQWFDIETAFIYQNYSPHDNCERMYFQVDNALKIDLIRQKIEKIKGEITESEYYYLLALLLHAVPFISNITGTYGAYLKQWDKRTFKKLELKEMEIKPSESICHCYNLDALDLAKQTESDLVYLDPPYNGRQYMPNYHILETIARYDNPEIKGKTGIRVDPKKLSDFCKKSKAKQAFEELLDTLKCRYILLSYNNEGLLSTDEMTRIIKSIGISSTFHLYEYDFRRYKNKIPNNQSGLKEQLYFIQKAYD